MCLVIAWRKLVFPHSPVDRRSPINVGSADTTDCRWTFLHHGPRLTSCFVHHPPSFYLELFIQAISYRRLERTTPIICLHRSGTHRGCHPEERTTQHCDCEEVFCDIRCIIDLYPLLTPLELCAGLEPSLSSLDTFYDLRSSTARVT